ncbi:MAG TPA: PIG-L deacetylase family protein [Saprospiraceae bacterium]|nr:PIG-L deacetylase family protein [Saprospiraceae bacterium]
MLENKKILVLAPHTDDGELGCGGLISKAVRQGATVFYAAFSTADESVPTTFPSNQLEIEVKQATAIIGIQPENLFIYKHTVRKLNYVRQEILEEMIKLRSQIKPDIVILPSRNDIHQDHSTVTAEGIRAFKNCSILGYELIWNNLSFATDYFCVLKEDDIQKKINALAAYKTQEGKGYMSPDFIRSMATVRGTQINTMYAEAFEVIRWIDN